MASSRVFVIGSIIYILTGSFSNVAGCSAMYRQDYTYSEEWGGFYKVHALPQDWESARLACQLEGANLAMPYSVEDTTTLKQIISAPQYTCGIFIGGKEFQAKGDYRTVEGHSLCRIPHEWADNSPKVFGDSCLVLMQDGTLADETCSTPLPFVCFKKFDPECRACRNPCKTSDRGYKFDQRVGSCYKFHNTPQTWGETVRTCANEGGHLVIINSVTESAILKDMFAEYPPEKIVGATYTTVIHVGFQNVFLRSDWRNVDGKNLTSSGFASWAAGQPDNAGNNEHCGSIFRNGLLNDVGCGAKCSFICEIEADTICQ